MTRRWLEAIEGVNLQVLKEIVVHVTSGVLAFVKGPDPSAGEEV